METLKIRCSALSNVANVKYGLTEKQSETLNDLMSKIKLTEKQAQTRDELIAKQNTAPDLTVGGKTYVENLVKEKIYGYKDFFTSKYTEKGNLCEDEAINLLNLYEGNLYEKNNQYFENDFITGTPDIITRDKIIDIKCPWSKKTFPIFENEAHNVDYEWQMRGYMMLTGVEQADVIYCLMSTPKKLVGDYEPYDIHDCDNLDLKLRFTKITYYRDEKLESQIIDMVKQARSYASDYTNKIFLKTL